jgi:hypothetical protein
MSLGGPERSQGLDDAVQFAWNAGLVIVAGAGNDGNSSLFYPAAFDHVISVGAFDEDHRRATFSNFGNWVDISAPGNVILSTYPMSACLPSTVPGDIGLLQLVERNLDGDAACRWRRGARVVAQATSPAISRSSTSSRTARIRKVWTPCGSTRGPFMAGSTSTTP